MLYTVNVDVCEEIKAYRKLLAANDYKHLPKFVHLNNILFYPFMQTKKSVCYVNVTARQCRPSASAHLKVSAVTLLAN